MTGDELRHKAVNLFNSHIGELEENKLCPKWVSESYNDCVAKYALTATKTLPRKTKMAREWDWCAASATAIQYLAGLGNAGVYEMSCGNMVTIAKAKGIWLEDESKYNASNAKIGDLVIYYWKDDAKNYASTDLTAGTDHVGMISEIHPDYMIVTEGNYKNGIFQRKLNYNGRYIRGFIQLDYDSVCDGVREKPADDIWLGNLAYGDKGNVVGVLQTLLVYLYNIDIGKYGSKKDGVDKSFGNATKAGVMEFQEKAGLPDTGIVDSVTWSHLLKGG